MARYLSTEVSRRVFIVRRRNYIVTKIGKVARCKVCMNLSLTISSQRSIVEYQKFYDSSYKYVHRTMSSFNSWIGIVYF